MLAKSCFHRVVLGGTPNQPQTGAAKQRIVCKADVSEACGSGRMGRTAALCESRLCKHACTICFHRVVLGGTPNQSQTGAAKAADSLQSRRV